MDLENTEAAGHANAKAPRVSLDDIRDNILEQHFVTGAEAVAAMSVPTMARGMPSGMPADHPLNLLTICILVLKNGFVVIGKSAPVSSRNFSSELGKKFAYEDAVRQCWPLMGYALRERIHRDG